MDLYVQYVKDKNYAQVGYKTVVCCLTLYNGFEIVGSSSCVEPNDFNISLAKNIALNNAFHELKKYDAFMRSANQNLNITIDERVGTTGETYARNRFYDDNVHLDTNTLTTALDPYRQTVTDMIQDAVFGTTTDAIVDTEANYAHFQTTADTHNDNRRRAEFFAEGVLNTLNFGDAPDNGGNDTNG